ncbi:MAG: AAA family ATPase, partial [Kiritimatiellae bacterium]|nr:AAA family ATPase [Kiritimatiellia bacterium]
MKNRNIKAALSRRLAGPLGNLVLVMGARQTGKTTLLRHLCSDYAYVSFDDPVVRPQLLSMSASDWLASYRRVILDEVQKAPAMFDTVKAMVDSQPDCRVVLSGSSQIMLMERVKESLAGRVSIFEMYPLTLPEMSTEGWDDPLRCSRLCRFLTDNNRDSRVFS